MTELSDYRRLVEKPMIEAHKKEMAAVKKQLVRANKIIGWMMPYIGTMCPPSNGLFDLNQHACENYIPEPGAETKGRPVNQRPNLPNR